MEVDLRTGDLHLEVVVVEKVVGVVGEDEGGEVVAFGGEVEDLIKIDFNENLVCF